VINDYGTEQVARALNGLEEPLKIIQMKPLNRYFGKTVTYLRTIKLFILYNVGILGPFV
jgi:hypothetical protein